MGTCRQDSTTAQGPIMGDSVNRSASAARGARPRLATRPLAGGPPLAGRARSRATDWFGSRGGRGWKPNQLTLAGPRWAGYWRPGADGASAPICARLARRGPKLVHRGAPPPRRLARPPAAGRHPRRVARRAPRPGPGAGRAPRRRWPRRASGLALPARLPRPGERTARVIAGYRRTAGNRGRRASAAVRGSRPRRPRHQPRRRVRGRECEAVAPAASTP